MNKIIINWVIYCLISFNNIARAEIKTDGTVGAVESLSKQMIIAQSLGKTIGNNLFHSFKTFRINAKESATFTGADNIKNVISRVTGGEVSSINGVLTSKLKNADFYLINPAGITFGDGARVDVPAAFHSSTANSLHFADGSTLNMTANNSTFSAAEPSSFDFLADHSGDINIKDNQLSFKKSNSVTLSANTINMSNNTIEDSGGTIKLNAVGTKANTIGLTDDNINALAGAITLDNTTINMTGDSAGQVIINSDKLTLRNYSQIDATNINGHSGEIKVNAKDIALEGGSYLATTTTGSADAGNIIIPYANTILIKGFTAEEGSWFSGLYLGTRGSGNGGNLELTTDKLTLSEGGLIRAAAAVNTNTAETRAGDITVAANTINLNSGGIITAMSSSRASAGSIAIIAKQSLTINGAFDTKAHPTITVPRASEHSAILSNADTSLNSSATQLGAGGDITIDTPTLTVANTGLISTSNKGDKNSGDIAINTEQLSLNNHSRIESNNTNGQGGKVKLTAKQINIRNSSAISTSTQGSGKAGNINAAADTISIYGDSFAHFTGIKSDTESTGDAGNIDVALTKALSVSHSGRISANTNAKGNAGSITISGGDIKLDGDGIPSQGSNFTGIANIAVEKSSTVETEKKDRGYLKIITSGNISLHGGGSILSASFSSKEAGSITIEAGNISIDGQGSNPGLNPKPGGKFTGISSAAISNSGNAGSVDVSVKNNLVIINGSAIGSSKINSSGEAGRVNITADTIEIGENSAITGRTIRASSGGTANVTVTANNKLSLSDRAVISIVNDTIAENPSSIKTSSLKIFSPAITLNNASITAASNGNVDAGDISITVPDELIMSHNSAITTSAETGNGGNINININAGELISLQHFAAFLTSVNQGTGDGGDINVSAKALVMNNALIQANAASGHGGDIAINLKSLITSRNQFIKGGKERINWSPNLAQGFNVIQAVSEKGISGNINIASPQLSISGDIIELATNILTLPDINHSPCDSIAKDSSLTKTSKGNMPFNPSEMVFIAPISLSNTANTVLATEANIHQTREHQPCTATLPQ